MNAVLIAVIIMLVLSLLRVHIVLALVIGAFAGGIVGGLGIQDTISVFTEGLGSNASIALSYALLGAFAVTLSKTGLPDALIDAAIRLVGKEGDSKRKTYSKVLILLIILIMSCFSQNIIPVHIAFIPILIPPFLKVLNELEVDRRLVASIITFGLITPYMWIPAGFGTIFHQIMQTNMKESGMNIDVDMIPKAMTIPSLGMIVGLLIAVFITYRKPRQYETINIATKQKRVSYTKKSILIAMISVVVTLVVQLQTDSMIFGALAGTTILVVAGVLKVKESEQVLTDGMRMMSFIGFVMISAAGFSEVLRKTGDVESLVKTSVELIGDNKLLAAFLMLSIGLLITMGIGSSFSTVPILTTIFVPLCMQLGFSEMATIAIIGTAGALGDAGSPASDSTLGPTSGLNEDGQHNHIWDTCVPTFLHYNIPVLIFGVIAAMVL
ncbi:Na+/H+ antiporter family protein [Ectobacillus antri]|uniref:Na+/H+ antiporter family protein n=1 Tax=Ectobacillus antri TaxID=2486280 RepID=A0ABT6H3D5_9BACI|nr:Na+/H+ antiporter family protein [Ectobacillus antri]MDG4656241.1 Na+/H+ antiporter family protein [Ectobacillus antri]MDG5752916.1 Na+/H+ antiporter family protein [Ectobacillus antri]